MRNILNSTKHVVKPTGSRKEDELIRLRQENADLIAALQSCLEAMVESYGIDREADARLEAAHQQAEALLARMEGKP